MRLTQDLRFAIRVILKDRWFTAVAALALGLGIGVNTTVFTFVNAVLVRGLPFDRSHEIYYVATRTLPDGDPEAASYGFPGLESTVDDVCGDGGIPKRDHERQRDRAAAGACLGAPGDGEYIPDPQAEAFSRT
jgi:hypothetical protein